MIAGDASSKSHSCDPKVNQQQSWALFIGSKLVEYFISLTLFQLRIGNGSVFRYAVYTKITVMKVAGRSLPSAKIDLLRRFYTIIPVFRGLVTWPQLANTRRDYVNAWGVIWATRPPQSSNGLDSVRLLLLLTRYLRFFLSERAHTTHIGHIDVFFLNLIYLVVFPIDLYPILKWKKKWPNHFSSGNISPALSQCISSKICNFNWSTHVVSSHLPLTAIHYSSHRINSTELLNYLRGKIGGKVWNENRLLLVQFSFDSESIFWLRFATHQNWWIIFERSRGTFTRKVNNNRFLIWFFPFFSLVFWTLSSENINDILISLLSYGVVMVRCRSINHLRLMQFSVRVSQLRFWMNQKQTHTPAVWLTEKFY